MTVSVWVGPADGVDVGYSVEVLDHADYVSVPDGRCGLAWSRGDAWWLGPSTKPWRSSGLGPVVGVRLGLDSGRVFAGEPLHQWRDQRVPLSSVVDNRTVRRLVDSLASSDDEGRVKLLSDLSSRQIAARGGPQVLAARLAHRIGEGEPIGSLSHSLSVSPRHLLRQCNDVFGMPPSTLRRILRLHRVARSRAIGPQRGWAATAVTEGYADESHLARDARSFTLTTLRMASSHSVRFVQDATSLDA